MTEAKTRRTTVRVQDFIDAAPNETRRADAKALVKLMRAATGEKPVMWGPTIIGFGSHKYAYESGHSGEICRIGFSPRKANLVFYLGRRFPERAALLKKLGKHKTGAACVYVNKLADIDQDVLVQMIERSWAWQGKRARAPS